MKLSITVILLLFLASCSSGSYPITSPHYNIPSGSKLVIKEDLVLLPNSGRVYIQYGRVVSTKEVDQYFPHCWLVSWKIYNHPIKIKMGSFNIVGSQKYEISLQNMEYSIEYASASNFLLAGSPGGTTISEYTTTLKIDSSEQQNIREFSCSHWADPIDDDHLTVAQINRTLGKLAELMIVK
ncbi:MAG: hypothetical protein OEY52_15145 [Gammaproteobacteria bacterium]|nr:hypothetical protein [Gammaproteobacteria bacterium]